MANPELNFLEHLPLDLWGDVGSNLALDGCAAALAALSVTCRSLHSISQPLLFRDVWIVQGCPPNNIEKSQQDEWSPTTPHTAAFLSSDLAHATVKSLTISCPCDNFPQCHYSSTYFPPVLGRVAESLVNLRQLTFHRTILSEPQFMLFAELPRLTDLVFDGGRLPERHIWSRRPNEPPSGKFHLTSVTMRHPIGFGPPSDWADFFYHVCTPSLRSYSAVRPVQRLERDESSIWKSLAEALTPDTLERFSVTCVRPADGALFHSILKDQDNITDLCIGTRLNTIQVPATLVPRLQRLAVPKELLPAFIQGRPISHVTVIDQFWSRDEEERLPFALASLKPYSNVIRSLHLSLHDLKADVLASVVENLLHLEHLKIISYQEVDEQFLKTDLCSLVVRLPRCAALTLEYKYPLRIDSERTTVKWQRKILDLWTKRISGLLRVELFERIWVRSGAQDWIQEHIAK